MKKTLARYPHIRHLVVANRGLLTLDNIEMLPKPRPGGKRALQFILAVPERPYGEFVDILDPMTTRAARAGR